MLREVVLLRQLKHPCVVELLDIVMPSDLDKFQEIYIVLEYCESDLKKLIKSSLTLEMVHIQTILYNLLHAIKYMHDSKVLHRDLKPANVLLNEDCTIKVCDFGLARSINGIGDLTKSILLTIKDDTDQGKQAGEADIAMVIDEEVVFE